MIHVFFDNSNIWGGAQATRNALEPLAPWQAFRIDYRNLFQLIEGGREAGTKILAGSVPPSNDSLWQYAEQCGYTCDLLRRVESETGSFVEQAVDEVLHMKIANAVLDFEALPQTLVIASGDGAVSKFQTGFCSQIERAIKHGWEAEVWSWSRALNRNFYELSSKYNGKVKIVLLDKQYNSLTFVQREYYTKGANGEKLYQSAPFRNVLEL